MLKVKFLSYFKFMQIVAQTFFISKKELRTIIELNVPGLLCPIFSFNPIHSPNNHTHHHNHHRNYHRRIPQPTLTLLGLKVIGSDDDLPQIGNDENVA